MSHGYATANALTGLAAASFVWSSAYTTNRTRLNDGRLDVPAASAGSAQGSGQTLKINLGAATALVGIALLNHNLASGACTVLVEAATASDYSDAATVKAASTIVTAAPNQKDTVLQFPSTNKQYWRLTFVHTGTKIVTLGEVMALTSITSLSRTKIYGHGENERYITNRNESDTGQVHATFLAGPIRTKRFSFKDLQGSTEREELMAMFRATRGGVTNLLWLEYIESTATAATAAAQECLWGKISESHGWSESDFNLFDVDGFELVGLGREVGA
ncbi:MAG: hypothetical protein WC700_18695 [Gemmatimonadaceae bacterium]|jgi:hypothetical protein